MTIAARNSGSAIRTIISDDPGEGTLPHFPAVVAVPRRLNMLIPMHSRIDLAHVRQDRSIERAVAARHRRWPRGGGLPVFEAKTPIQRSAQPGTAGHPRKPPDRRALPRSLALGVIPHGCRDPAGGRKPVNAKAETVATLPSAASSRSTASSNGMPRARASAPTRSPCRTAPPSASADCGRIGSHRSPDIGCARSASSPRPRTCSSAASMIVCR